MKIKKVPVFILMDNENNIIIAAESLNEAKEYKNFIQKNFNTDKQIIIKEKTINKPDESIIKNQKNNYIFVIKNESGEIFSKFDSLNEAKMFLKRMINSFGSPNNHIQIKQIFPQKQLQGFDR